MRDIDRKIIFFRDGDFGSVKVINPLKIIFLTSVRDTGTCDRNGIWINLPERKRYMEGVIERTVKETYPQGKLHGLVEVVGIITDDMEHDMRASDFPIQPQVDSPWIYPLNLRNPNGTKVIDLTVNIQSDFRRLPLDAMTAREEGKLAFETIVAEKMNESGANVLISDHYMARIDYLVGEQFKLYGRVLNIHPAVTLAGHQYCLRGRTPTVDAIERAKQERKTFTGATLHVINKVIDAGPVLAYSAITPVYPDDQPQYLRYRNYQMAKLPVFIQGLIHYVRNIYPYLQQINFASLKPSQN